MVASVHWDTFFEANPLKGKRLGAGRLRVGPIRVGFPASQVPSWSTVPKVDFSWELGACNRIDWGFIFLNRLTRAGVHPWD